MQRILLVDSDPATSRLLSPVLHREGYQVKSAPDGQKAMQLKQAFSPDLILLNWLLPDIHGLEACRKLRQTCTTPVILLISRSEKTAPLRSLELCADDTLVKPFSAREALAHIRAILRRVNLDRQGIEHSPVQVGEFSLDRSAHRALKGRQELRLSAREFDILSLLLERAGQAISRAELMAHVWGSRWFGDPHTLDVHIRWLRLKIEEDPAEPQYIQTIHGYGYRFAGQDESRSGSEYIPG